MGKVVNSPALAGNIMSTVGFTYYDYAMNGNGTGALKDLMVVLTPDAAHGDIHYQDVGIYLAKLIGQIL